jgi:DNA-binding NarL/FixJ family response regulator
MPHSTIQHPAVPLARTVNASLGIALVDSVPLFRDGLSALVQRTAGMRWMGATERPYSALQLCERFRPDVVLIDSALDPRNHLSNRLVGSNDNLGVLLLIGEAHRTTQYLASALAGGVHGMVLRSAEPAQLLDAIRSVHMERRYLDTALAPSLAAPADRLSPLHGPAQRLSRREYQVLQLIAEGLENQAIAKILYVSVETVRTHVKSILRKLAARDRTHAVAVAFRTGMLTARGESRP